MNNQIVASKMLIVPQFGETNILPVEILKNKNIVIEFFPEYGSLKRIGELNSKTK